MPKEQKMPAKNLVSALVNWSGEKIPAEKTPTDIQQETASRKCQLKTTSSIIKNLSTTSHAAGFVGSVIAVGVDNNEFMNNWFRFGLLIMSGVMSLLNLVIRWRVDSQIEVASKLQTQIGKPTDQTRDVEAPAAMLKASEKQTVQLPTTYKSIFLPTPPKEIPPDISESGILALMRDAEIAKSLIKQCVDLLEKVAHDISHPLVTWAYSVLLGAEKIITMYHKDNPGNAKNELEAIFVIRVIIPIVMPPLALIAFGCGVWAMRHMPNLKKDMEVLRHLNQKNQTNSNNMPNSMHITEVEEDEDEQNNHTTTSVETTARLQITEERSSTTMRRSLS